MIVSKPSCPPGCVASGLASSCLISLPRGWLHEAGLCADGICQPSAHTRLGRVTQACSGAAACPELGVCPGGLHPEARGSYWPCANDTQGCEQGSTSHHHCPEDYCVSGRIEAQHSIIRPCWGPAGAALGCPLGTSELSGRKIPGTQSSTFQGDRAGPEAQAEAAWMDAGAPTRTPSAVLPDQSGSHSGEGRPREAGTCMTRLGCRLCPRDRDMGQSGLRTHSLEVVREGLRRRYPPH